MGVVVGSLLAVIAAAAPVASTNPSMTRPAGEFHAPVKRVPGVGLIKLVPTTKAAAAGFDADVIKGIAGRSGVDVKVVRASVYGWLIVEVKQRGSAAVPDEDVTLALLDRLADDVAVQAVSEDKWMRAFVNDPNDELHNFQWPLDVLHMNSAWDVTQGVSSQRIGVIDTGIVRNHEDFSGKIAGGFDFISGAQSAQDGGGRDADFQDAGDQGGGQGSFHGSHVAGTIAANTDNGIGVSGLNRNAQLVIVRALGLGGGDLVDIMEGAAWLAGASIQNVPAVGANRVSVMNLSLGSDAQCSQFEQDVIDEIDAAGVIFVAAAGNSNHFNDAVSDPNHSNVGSPANCNGVVAVGAHGQDLTLAGYSSFGAEVDIVAPGGDQSRFGNEGGVLSTIGPDTNAYAFFEGTSMAAPHVTGVISLMQAIDPTMGRVKAEQLLVQTAQGCNSCQGKLAMDADAAVRATTPGSDPDPVDPDPVDPGPGDLVDDAFEENDTVVAGRNLACNSHLDLVALPSDQDWFDVAVGPGAFSVSISAGANDLDLYLVKDGNIVGQSDTASGDELIRANVEGDFVVQVLINPFVDEGGNSASGAYGLDIACVPGTTPLDPDPVEPDPVDPGPVGEDDVEPNDDEGSAVELFCDETRALTLTDDDWFFVAVRDGDTLEVDKAGAADVEVEIVDGAGTVIGAGSAAAVARALPGGDYLVHVPVGAVDDYRLSVKCRAPQLPTSNEPPPSCATSTPTSALPLLGLLLVLRRRRRSV